MLLTLLAAYAMVQAVPAVPAIAARPLKDLPDTTTTYYDVAGRDRAAIEKSMKSMLADPAAKQALELYVWKVGATFSKRTEGTKCTVQKATAKMTSTVRLPRLADAARVDKEVADAWKGYVATLEADAAANLWFINDRLRGAEQALVGVDCAAMAPSWNAALAKVKAEQIAFATKRATAPAAKKR